MVNFQMYDGKFNINEFTRLLAVGEAESVLKGDPFPNQLTCEIIRAKNLKPHRLKKSCDPYVVVRVRRNVKNTGTQNETRNPMWKEKLIFNLDDPSVVMEIAVYDRDAPDGSQRAFLGHWAMTTKYLIYNPTFTFHVDNKDFKTYYRGDREDGALGFEGWVPLASKGWEEVGDRGHIQIRLLWQHVDPSELTDTFVERRKYTALEQLTQQSQEDKLRFGAWSRLRHWLNHEPFCYDVQRFTVRRTRFYLQDLFRGYKGKPEMLRKNDKLYQCDYVPINFLEITDRFRPKPGSGDIGITTYHVFVNFFLGLVFKFLRGGKLGKAFAQIMAGGVFGMGINFANVFRGDFQNTTVGPQGIKDAAAGIAKATSTGLQVLNQKTTKNAANKRQFKTPVDASDTDFLMDEIDVSGYLDRHAVGNKENLTVEKLGAMAKKSGSFKTNYFELKGQSLFFRQNKEKPESKVYALTYKTRLLDVSTAVYCRSQQEIILNVQAENHIIRLRKCKNNVGETKSLQAWFQVFAEKGIPCTEIP
eukprot:CAMPEP_0204870236 /NCGR_PEP_ID=MMETSP1348-20121228/31893_1 /ASSEMBLY_ACC=CAM_ASM_000700 /TAXON_ID=215587 /ORGANISM="Aplanochytrium stocchinoi, Strain GSBS06" /LENGTH=529 /DNA_ID=CAMNT_0052023941 /DNA_START=15 /DNA_END=1604 /DNA_ORIENTATION=-